ncbi:hypothetical protein SteCoe_14804 [Stentor coeruleus]|uniref:Macro domain-containing protein n=1 Tax=Stentor coeruleus TaxID=5963 RepID=A0A1R2C512_9CILI|nr:hypothetical protein SteCoe_14804 [Stentor coeruleus]
MKSSSVLLTTVYKGVNLSVVRGDITNEIVDAIVNAANQHLSHGGGVAGAIIKKGGYIIQQESDKYVKQHGIVHTGNAGITGPGKLNCKNVIHAVGPVYSGRHEDQVLLADAVKNSYRKAQEFNLKSISLPAISSGIFGFPKDLCAKIIISETKSYIDSENNLLKIIRFVNFDSITCEIMAEQFRKVFHKELGLAVNEDEEEKKTEDNIEVKSLEKKVEELNISNTKVKNTEKTYEEEKKIEINTKKNIVNNTNQVKVAATVNIKKTNEKDSSLKTNVANPVQNKPHVGNASQNKNQNTLNQKNKYQLNSVQGKKPKINISLILYKEKSLSRLS